MDTVVSICLGIGLSAACGFRVFVPLLAMSIASLSGHLTLAPGFQWVGTYPALLTFGVATVTEIAGYYIPWVDHLLDTVSTPAAVLAGILATASVMTGADPLLKWSLAIIAGGGAAAAVQGTTVAARGLSLAGTGGLANPILSTVELAFAVTTTIVAIFAPLLVVVLIALFCFVGLKLMRRARKPKPASAGT